ncbi:hypothetical protein [Hymenobacter koreensis]|uniref:DUF3592 domain-containing protein n=1 Tax=Hymenobacter koreensis TaxID=1084523 RepID=A0ABP8IY60_9BACT
MRYLNVWAIMFFIGLYFVGLMLYTAPKMYRKHEVARQGELVGVQVTRLAQTHLGKTLYYLDFRYQERAYSIRVARKDLEAAVVGQTVLLRHWGRYPDIFLPEGETMRGELISRFLLLLMASYGAVYSLKLWRTGGELIRPGKRPNRLRKV